MLRKCRSLLKSSHDRHIGFINDRELKNYKVVVISSGDVRNTFHANQWISLRIIRGNLHTDFMDVKLSFPCKIRKLDENHR
jgi:hypothetical protein